MKNKTLSHNILRIMFVFTLAVVLALNGLSPAKASSTGYSVIAWGFNNGNATDIPDGLTDVVAIATGFAHNLALKSDGTVVAWGSNSSGQTNVPAGLTDVVAISAGQDHSLALKSDGTVVAWGHNYWGQTDAPAGLTGVTAISAGSYHNLALKGDGTVVAWGYNGYHQTDVPADLTNVIAVAAGWVHSLALKADGTVVGWGSNQFGQASVPASLTDVIAISGGYIHSLALKGDGTVVGWGDNPYGEATPPSGLTNVTTIFATGYRSVALKRDGTVVAWGDNTLGQNEIPSGLTGVVAVAAGPYHILALVPQGNTNTAPTANPSGPYLGAVNTAIAFDGSLSSDPEANPLTYAWDFGDTSTGTGAAPSHSYAAAGVYSVCLAVDDGSLAAEPACTLAVVYDPSAGFVTGGGWINSPAGAYLADSSLTGKATFGFIAKYQKGATLPSGTTAFAFDVAGLSFASQSYDWLVVNQAGANAQFKGSGTLNGALDSNGQAYRFMLWAEDGASTDSADTFRIKIWSEAGGPETIVYDNGVAQAIGAGNIVVHTSK